MIVDEYDDSTCSVGPMSPFEELIAAFRPYVCLESMQERRGESVPLGLLPILSHPARRQIAVSRAKAM